jgi:hypothetical protein
MVNAGLVLFGKSMYFKFSLIDHHAMISRYLKEVRS